MDGSDIYKASRSFNLGSSRTTSWRDSGLDVFSQSNRHEDDDDDEEALKCAVLEKLPTSDRLKKGLLYGSSGSPDEIFVDNLGVEDRKHLLDRLVKVPEEDNEKFLLKLRDRIDTVGIDLPTIEVRFEHLTVEADAFTGCRSLPSFLNFIIEILEYRRGGCNGHRCSSDSRQRHQFQQQPPAPLPQTETFVALPCFLWLFVGLWSSKEP
ncbi:unnamed protein product [Lactuca virosa]|uniref:Pleiotropic ABC efflux transporter N-terminal domain-containing protein n=1 Tax=Lactuca virosa TaxID=75947 RepID=A0AAU9MLP0_9ASTR|nr:unnamed protein product [Lactuca virosa]